MLVVFSVDGQRVIGDLVKTGPRTLLRLFWDGKLVVSKVGKKVGC
jgi:hypothetical protein